MGIVLCGSLLLGVKFYMGRTPSAAQAKTPDAPLPTALPLAFNMKNAQEEPVLSGSYNQIRRDPFQTTVRHKAVEETKRTVHTPEKLTSSRPPRRSGQVALNLKAIVLGAHPKAFINETFVGEGQSFDIGQLEKETCQVISIDEQVVKVKVGQKIRVLRLASDRVTEKNPWRF
jgi:hypothetical protein